jgi:hypothetical protein
MTDEPVITEVETSEPSGGMTEAELETIIGRVVDARLAPLSESVSKLQPLDVDTLRAGILEDVGNLFQNSSRETLDEGKLTTTIGNLLDNKLKGIGANTKRVGGPLSRWLGA